MANGPGDILDLIRRGQASTRGEVLEATGLSRMTVSQRIDLLFTAGLILEGGTTGATGGRRSRSLNFNVEHSRVLVATVDTTHTRIALTDLAGRLLAESRIDVAVANGPSVTLDAMAAAMTALLHGNGLTNDDVCGIGISVPGPVDPQTGRPSQPPIMPGWDAYPIAEHLKVNFSDTPILTANDADAAAFGEHAWGHFDSASLCLIKVSTGIGTGIVIDGESYRGVDGGAGDIGHVRLANHPDALCQCGAYGCLAAVASGRAVAQQLTELGIPASSGREVGELLSAGNAEAAQLTQTAGRLIGEVMATVVCLLNPGVVLIGGALASAPLLAGIRESLYRLSLPRATRHLALQLGTLGDDAALIGLTRLVVNQEFGPDAINTRLAL